MAYLKQDIFNKIVEHAPLIAVDFIVTNSQGDVLLGKRNSPPAKGRLCVPGGRILKGETVKEAVRRKLSEELGIEHSPVMIFVGFYEHFYDESAFDPKISTHYLTIAFQFEIDSKHIIKACDQHESFSFINRNEVLSSKEVPIYMKNYFRGDFKSHLNMNLL